VLRVVVQAGHAPEREPGHEAQTGTPGEIELVSAIQRRLVRLLRAHGAFEPIPVPGDIPDGIEVDAALFLHADGAANPQARGFSFGYPDHPVNKRLADLIREEILRIPGHPPARQDNYTADMRQYYGYRRVISPGPEVLHETAFLTNPQERRWARRHINAIARAQFRALCRYFGQPIR